MTEILEKDRRDAEIARLKREVEALRERERAARAEAEDARKHFSELTAMSRRFAQSMRAGVGERQQFRRRLAAQYAVSRVLSEARDLDEAAPRIFEVLGERLGWDLGVLWTLDRQAGMLRRAGIWRTTGSSPGTMEEACKDMRFRRGEGLPGRVWEREEPVWVEDVLEDEGFLRKEVAAEEGLHGALAFPIRDGGFVGVFEFFQGEVLSPDEDLLRTASLIGSQIGQFLQHRQAEEAARRAAKRDRYRVVLTDALRPLTNPTEIQAAAMRVLGEHLQVDRVLYAEIVDDGETISIADNYVSGDNPKIFGRFPASDFSTASETLRAGQTFVTSDINRDETLSETEREALRALNNISCVAVPLIREGRWVSNLGMYHGEPRLWTAEEIQLLQETAERTWAAVEHARAEEALRESEERFRQFAENSEDVLWILDANTRRLEYLSPAYERVWGERRSLVIDDLERWEKLVHPEDRQRAREGMSRLLAGETFSQEYRIVRQVDGEERWILDTGFPITDETGHIRRVGGIAQDITERKEAEKQREQSLAREWRARAEAEERKRISRELHDRVAHSMGVVHQSLELYEAFKERNPGQAETKIRLARETTREALNLTRNLSRELQDTEAKDGLSVALSNLLKTAVPPGIESSIHVEGDERLVPPRVREQLFLIMREAVRNTVSHSGADRLGIEVKVSAERVVGRVEDDGRGFGATSESDDGVPGSGLQSIKERARLVGGDLRISSAPEAGTKIEAFIPLSQNESSGRAGYGGGRG